MIGDWYAFRGHPYKCTASDIEALAKCEENGIPTDISGIPLTPEILEKNFRGYKLGSGALAYFIYELNEDYFIRASAGEIYLCMHYDDSEHAAHDDIYLVELKYVHTLQLALMLFGFDKEIVL